MAIANASWSCNVRLELLDLNVREANVIVNPEVAVLNDRISSFVSEPNSPHKSVNTRGGHEPLPLPRFRLMFAYLLHYPSFSPIKAKIRTGILYQGASFRCELYQDFFTIRVVVFRLAMVFSG
jgi:hypothetical protein